MSATPEQIADWLMIVAVGDAANEYTNRAEHMRAAAATLRAQAERVRVLEAALEAIRDTHIPDQPMADDIDEAEYARKHHLALRLVAKAALISARALRGAP